MAEHPMAERLAHAAKAGEGAAAKAGLIQGTSSVATSQPPDSSTALQAKQCRLVRSASNAGPPSRGCLFCRSWLSACRPVARLITSSACTCVLEHVGPPADQPRRCCGWCCCARAALQGSASSGRARSRTSRKLDSSSARIFMLNPAIWSSSCSSRARRCCGCPPGRCGCASGSFRQRTPRRDSAVSISPVGYSRGGKNISTGSWQPARTCLVRVLGFRV